MNRAFLYTMFASMTFRLRHSNLSLKASETATFEFELKLKCRKLNVMLANIVYRKAMFISFPTIPHSGSKVQWEFQKMYPREACQCMGNPIEGRLGPRGLCLPLRQDRAEN